MATLADGEVFSFPTIKQVIFQIRFPKLFFLQNKVGDFQLAVMAKFPKSELVVQRSLVFASGTDKEAVEKMLQTEEDESVERIWRFEGDSGVVIELKLDSLTLLSTKHKSYAHGEQSFRAVIEEVLAHFFRVAPIPLVARIGLRYVDDCPFPEYSTICFKKYFASILPVDRFGIESSRELTARAVQQLEKGSIRHVETLIRGESGQSMIIDMDAFKENVLAADAMTTADDLHGMIRRSFEATVLDPVITYMREGKMP